jgi:hypothetical protein
MHFTVPLPAPVLVFQTESEKSLVCKRCPDMFRDKDHITDKLFVALAWLMALSLMFLVFEKIKWLLH